MAPRTWFITGASSGFGLSITQQLLEKGDRVIGTVREAGQNAELVEPYGDRYSPPVLDVTDTAALREVFSRAVTEFERIDVVISNAGYGLFGAAEELSDEQIDRMIATNLVGSIQLIRAALPHLRAQGGGRIIQISTYGGQVAFAGNSLYHATKWGIDGFAEAVAQEVAPFGIGVTIVEPGGARTEFRYGSAQVADIMPAYDDTPAHSFLKMLDPATGGLAPGDPARMATAIIASVDQEPAPLRIMLGSQALESTRAALGTRLGCNARTARILRRSVSPLEQPHNTRALRDIGVVQRQRRRGPATGAHANGRRLAGRACRSSEMPGIRGRRAAVPLSPAIGDDRAWNWAGAAARHRVGRLLLR
jgi:NAD(P)-dependent dehydrogenase (short-subunit alcohol dehydrogenase family)